MPLTPSLDRIGPLCRTVEDAALVMATINGPDPTSPTSVDVGFFYDGGLDVTKLRVGYSPGWFERVGFGPGASVPVAQAHRNALEALRGLGVELVEVELEPLPYGFLINNLNVEAAALYEDMTLTGSDDQLEIQESYAWPNSWRQARLLSAVDYLQLERFRRQVMEQMQRIFSEVDAVFGPTYGSFDLLLVTNYTGHPGISLRAGLGRSPTRSILFTSIDPNGPERTITHNVAFHGRLYEEGTILALARALESELGVWHHRPPVD
jgi:Asp-tRNA(Asn)/Glu-tRNA(Gln) amidotransferase A subunit family amidase